MFVFEIPQDTQLGYYAEGAANILYRVVPRDDSTFSPSQTTICSRLNGNHSPTSSANTPSHALRGTPLSTYDDVVTPPTEADLEPPRLNHDDLTPPPTEIDPVDRSFLLDRRRLLRLRKKVPSCPTLRVALELRNQFIQPLFPPDLLLDHEAVVVSSTTLQKLNKQLKASEEANARPRERHGVYLDEGDEWGVLVDDMSLPSPNGDEVVLLEIKPKWLIQSTRAPPSAARCRTCALRAMRGQLQEQSNRWCPLDLASGDRASVTRVIAALTDPAWAARCFATHNVTQDWLVDARARIVNYLLVSPILSTLKDRQIQFAQNTGLDPEEHTGHNRTREGLKISPCMTLRDCTLFIRVPIDRRKPIEGKLGDLDVKFASDDKLLYWSSIESSLAKDGWYHGREVNDSEGEKPVCRLARGHDVNEGVR